MRDKVLVINICDYGSRPLQGVDLLSGGQANCFVKPEVHIKLNENSGAGVRF